LELNLDRIEKVEITQKVESTHPRVIILVAAAVVAALLIFLIMFPDIKRAYELPDKARIQSMTKSDTLYDKPQAQVNLEGQAPANTIEKTDAEIEVNPLEKLELSNLRNDNKKLAPDLLSQQSPNDWPVDDSDNSSAKSLIHKDDEALGVATGSNANLNGAVWVSQQARSFYTLQVISAREPIVLSDYLQVRPNLNANKLKQLGSSSGWYYLLYGLYSDSKQAKAARSQFNELDGVMVRNIGELQDIRCKNRSAREASAVC
jgi:septal ring-binding cell division protein DamX